MSIKRYDARRDANEPEIISAARQLGVRAWKLDEPADWLALIGGQWFPVEVKSAVGDLTGKQQIFHNDAAAANGEVLVWRSVSEMITDVNRLRVSRNQRSACDTSS